MSRTPVTFAKKNYLINFKKRYPNVNIMPAEHFDILKAAGGVIADFLLNDGDVKMASRLSNLQIRKFTPKGNGVNFRIQTKPHESAKLKKPVYEFNDHTDGFVYRFLWNKKSCKGVRDVNMWVFKPMRSLKRRLAKILISKLNDYPIGV